MSTQVCLALFLLGVGISRGSESGRGPVRVGEAVQNFLSDDIPELLGGLTRVIDRFHGLDDKHLSCGKRQFCEAMSIGAAIERSDGSLSFEKGFLRQAVDSAGEVIFDLARPLLDTFGLGRVARREVSFTSFVVDMIDSAIIGITRVLAGRRLSRQIEAVSPVATLIEPAGKLLSIIPISLYGSVLDITMDITGLADRDTGLYGLTRSGGLGYFYGGGETNVCQHLHGDCDEPINILDNINENRLGQTMRIGGSGPDPLMDSTRNVDAMRTSSFELADLLKPKKMLCKVDSYLKALQGHIDQEEVFYITDEQLLLLPGHDMEENIKVRNDGVIRLQDFANSKSTNDFVHNMEQYEHYKIELDYHDQISVDDVSFETNLTNAEKFDNFCDNEQQKEIKRILIARAGNNTQVRRVLEEMEILNSTSTDTEDTEETEEIDDYESVVIQKSEGSFDKSLQNLELLARLGDHSLLSEKMDVEDGSEFEAVESLVNTFNMAANGKIERVVKIDSKKGVPTLLIQFDSTEYRDAVLKSSRSPEARSSTRARLRRPKVKDLKHVVSLLTNH
jgi:hypothetical protein